MPDWREILSRDGPAAWRTAYRLLGNRADADECFQEACLAALQVSRREQVHNWQGLLKRLAVARSVDRLRNSKRSKLQASPSALQQVEDSSPPPPQDLEDAELHQRSSSGARRIPPRQAEAFCLHCVEECSYQEVAQALKISVDAVGVLIHRAHKQLRELLAGSHVSFTQTNAAPGSLRKEHS